MKTPKRCILVVAFFATTSLIGVFLLGDFLNTSSAKQSEKVPNLDQAIKEI